MMRKRLVHHNFILALFILLFLPGLLSLLVVCVGPHAIFKWMASNYKLHGITQETTDIKSQTIQKYIEEKITQQLPLRSLFIRLNNQIYYSFFKKSYSEQGEVIIGKTNQLITKSDIATYCVNKSHSLTELTKWADKLSVLNTFFKKRNQTFIYVITPSKVEYMPHVIPNRFHCENNKMTSHLQQMEPLLKQRNISYINGANLMQAATRYYGIPMFPRGGIHWNTLGASIGVNATIKAINDKNQSTIPPILFNYKLSDEPKDQDKDMLNLLNLIRPNDNYIVPMVNFAPASSSSKSLSVACIGGSFLRQMVDIFLQNKTFSKISYYRYFKLDKTNFRVDKEPIKQNVDTSSPATLDDILAADIVILEENSAITVSNHGQLFYTMMEKFYI